LAAYGNTNMYPMAFGQRLVEVSAELDHSRAECAHGGVLVRRVAVRHVDPRRDARPSGRKLNRLAMIAARGRDDPVTFARDRFRLSM